MIELVTGGSPAIVCSSRENRNSVGRLRAFQRCRLIDILWPVERFG